MKYETPELTAIALAIQAIQNSKKKDGSDGQDPSPAYEDWE
jgi:hypothetical protein